MFVCLRVFLVYYLGLFVFARVFFSNNIHALVVHVEYFALSSLFLRWLYALGNSFIFVIYTVCSVYLYYCQDNAIHY